MSKALNLSLLASRNNLGNLGDAFISEGNNVAPSLGPLSAGVLTLNGIKQLPSQVGTNKSTGVVTISAEPHLGELNVPGWDKGQHITQWSTLQTYLSGIALTNRTIPASAVYAEFVSVGSTPNNVGGCLAPNGKIYFAASSPTYVFDPVSNTVSNIGNITTGGNNYISVLATNGFIYTAPTNSPFIQKINPANNTSTSFSSTYPAGSNARTFGATLGPNGKIYCAPCTSVTQVLVIDPTNNDSVTTLSTNTLIAGSTRYVGAITAPNGKIYFIPYSASSVMVVDPSNNDAIATFAFGKNVSQSFYGSALGPDGKIYCPPNGETYCLVIDPNTNTCSSIVATAGSGNFTNANTPFLAPNGKIYAFDGGSLYHVIDPSNNTATKNMTLAGAAGYIGTAIVHPSGKVIFPPYTGTSAVVLNFLNNNNWSANICTNPIFNR